MQKHAQSGTETLTCGPSLHAGNKGTCSRYYAPHICVLMADSSGGYYKQQVPVDGQTDRQTGSGTELCEWTRDTEGGEGPLLPN